MVAAKDSEEIEKKTEEITAVVPEAQVITPSKTQVTALEAPKSQQTMLTLAIISAAVLFFVGLGLGYVVGHTSASRRLPMNGLQFPGDNDGGRRFYPNSGTRNSTNSGSSSATTPQTGTN